MQCPFEPGPASVRSRIEGRSAVDFAAVFYGQDADRATVVVEADAVVADAQPHLGRLNVLDALHVPVAGGEIAGNGVQDAQGGGLVDGAQAGLGLVGSGDALLAHAHCPGWCGSGSSGVCPMRSKSSAVRPNSARTSSLGMGS